METVGLGFCFEDLPVGRRFKTIGRTITETDITNFVSCTGMVEVLFTNLEFLAHESDIKQRLAPAALVYAFAEGLLVQATMQHTGLAFLHMELNVENPVLPATRSMPSARSSKPASAEARATAGWCAPVCGSSSRTARRR
jgi:acyl dehydratase